MATNRQAIIWKHIQLFILATSFAAATGQELCEECTCDTTLNGVKKLACQPVTKALEELISQIPDEYGELEMRRGNFPTLTNYSFVSLNNLKRLVIDNCNVKTIEVGAFASLKNLEELELKANDFFTLPESVFEDLARLKKLTLADNLLTHLTTDIFVGLTNLEILDVERNFLEDISYDSFSSLTSLKQLMLNKNMISSLPSTIFEFNQQLEEVHLNKNKLQELHPMTFNTTPLLQKVYLEENKITTLSEQLFVGNNEITVVSLTGNLFTCNCEMAGFRLWMELDETLKTAEVNGKCGSPDSLKGTDLLDVPHADLVCTTTTTTTTTAPTSTTTETLHTSFLNITSHSHDGSKWMHVDCVYLRSHQCSRTAHDVLEQKNTD
ncbi:carboxypeptidase N subunit 2-like [Watersipora subatra]|uniref:carboxypeptidase N subunit 2-like n=1 Tax=Watersipora subatra TaxID=2589382 RepID=UPI00355B9245